MSTSRLSGNLIAPVMLGSIMLALSFASHAQTSQPEAKSSAACNSARLSAWFERQRQLEDGDTDPFAQPKMSAECAKLQASNDEARPTDKQAATPETGERT